MEQTGFLRAICTSPARGTAKTPVQAAKIVAGWGVEGDAHGGDWHRQISLLDGAELDAFNARGADVSPGAFGENLVVDGIVLKALAVGGVLTVGDVLLELTQFGKECHSRCAIFDKMGDCIMPRAGVFARVLHGGTVAVGDAVTAQSAPFRAAVVTVSDRGAAGERAEDTSGDCAEALLRAAGYAAVARVTVPDERAAIEAALMNCADELGVALVVTTGGTGFSPRDVTPEATLAVAERLAPGVAEAMRAGAMAVTPRAMLSRGVAVLRGRTLIVNLPGSPKAVQESLALVLPALWHGLELLQGEKGDCAQ